MENGSGNCPRPSNSVTIAPRREVEHRGVSAPHAPDHEIIILFLLFLLRVLHFELVQLSHLPSSAPGRCCADNARLCVFEEPGVGLRRPHRWPSWLDNRSMKAVTVIDFHYEMVPVSNGWPISLASMLALMAPRFQV